MKHHKTRTMLIVLAIVTTVMFLEGIPVSFPALTAMPTMATIWVISAVLLLPVVLLMLGLIMADMLHSYILEWEDREEALRQKKADREYYYAHRRRMRALEEKQYQRKYRYPTNRRKPRSVRVHQRPVDPKDYGC